VLVGLCCPFFEPVRSVKFLTRVEELLTRSLYPAPNCTTLVTFKDLDKSAIGLAEYTLGSSSAATDN